MDTQNQNSVESAEPAAVASPPSRRDGLLTLIVSVGVFAAVGAWVGSKLGKLGDKKNHNQATRILSWGGAVAGGLLAWAAQPKPPATMQPVAAPEPVSDTARIEIVQPPHKNNAGPLPQVASETAQTQGLLEETSERVRA